MEMCLFPKLLVQLVHCIKGHFWKKNIRVLRSTQPVPKPHLLMEYAYMSCRAADERSKHPNYRPILDYDSLPSNRGQNQEGGRTKSKEELLAEERDYKRRCTSYRGKKVKGSPTEILRDIIEEHMEVIKQAGKLGSHQTSTEHASSKPDNSKKSTASDTYLIIRHHLLINHIKGVVGMKEKILDIRSLIRSMMIGIRAQKRGEMMQIPMHLDLSVNMKIGTGGKKGAEITTTVGQSLCSKIHLMTGMIHIEIEKRREEKRRDHQYDRSR